jgi:hypothetical protein
MGFSSEERDRRWERARNLMAGRGWDALVICGEDGLCGGNFRYLADFRPVKGHTLLLLPLEGEPVLWVEHRVHEQAARKLSFVDDCRYTLDCGEAAAGELETRGLVDAPPAARSWPCCPRRGTSRGRSGCRGCGSSMRAASSRSSAG